MEMDSGADHAKQDANMWHLMSSGFSHDIGSQRCRLPVHLITKLKASHFGSYFLIDFGSHSSLCSLSVWNNQASNCFQADDTVTLPRSVNGHSFPTSTTISTESFQQVHLVTAKRVKIKLILEDFQEVENFQNDQVSLTSQLNEVLSKFVITPGCIINCQHSEQCRVLKIHLIIVLDCPVKPLSAAKVSSKTTVEIASVLSRPRYEALIASRTTVTTIGGLDEPRQHLTDLVNCPFDSAELLDEIGISCPKGILLIGPPGTGKTSLVNVVAQDCGACLVNVAGPSMCRPQPGESEAVLRSYFKKALDLSKEGPCILFIDEIDSFLLKKDDKTGTQSDRLLQQMLTLMDGLKTQGKMVIVGATNRPNALDPAVRRPGRFDDEVYIGVPTRNERLEILKSLTHKFQLQNVNLENVADWTPGYVGADLTLLCQEIVWSKSSEDKLAEDVFVTENDFRHGLMLMRPSTQRASFSVSNYQPIGFDDIGGLNSVKLELRQSLEWPILHADVFRRLGVSRPKGVLLYGPPGCCKTTLVRAAATACNASFFSASAAQLYSPYVGDSEKSIVEIFHRSRLAAPTILFFDEIDSIVGKRAESSNHSIHEKVLTALLNEMDGIGVQLESRQGSYTCGEQLRESGDTEQTHHHGEKGDVLVVAATNRPDMLDDALMRPGRFDRIVYVPPPDFETRKQILQVVTRKMPVANIDLEDLAARTNCFSGADLHNLCKEAALCALRKNGLGAVCIDQEHFMSVLETMEPSLSNEQLNFFAKLQQKYQNIL